MTPSLPGQAGARHGEVVPGERVSRLQRQRPLAGGRGVHEAAAGVVGGADAVVDLRVFRPQLERARRRVGAAAHAASMCRCCT